jgi:hypothetical protein
VLATAAPRASPSAILFQFDEKSQIVTLDRERASRIEAVTARGDPP